MRPPEVWNFFQDKNEEQIPHVLRATAKPQECYKDGRVEKILESIELVGGDLRRYVDVQWNRLLKDTMAVFHDMNRKQKIALEEA